jgi:hypothetical protein
VTPALLDLANVDVEVDEELSVSAPKIVPLQLNHRKDILGVRRTNEPSTAAPELQRSDNFVRDSRQTI